MLPASAALVFAAVAEAKYPSDFAQRLERITFGSCNRADFGQPLWAEMKGSDLFIWLGDNVYADTTDRDEMRAAFRAQFDQPEYVAFRQETPIIGIWDDHDYGKNNAGIEFDFKTTAQAELLDFLEEPEDSRRRTQEGIYTSYVFGPAGQQVKVILLDTRYFAEVEKAVAGDDTADILGEAQWHWLARELRQSPAQVHLIASGIQVLAPNHRFEKWANFPRARARLLGLIADLEVPGVIFLSGDRHIGEISLMNTPDTPYPMIDITASSLTHAWKGMPGERNDFRIGPIVREDNYGQIEIEWDDDVPSLEISLEGEEGTFTELDVALHALQPFKDRGF